MRFLLILPLLAMLASCETWQGFKKDVKNGTDAVSSSY